MLQLPNQIFDPCICFLVRYRHTYPIPWMTSPAKNMTKRWCVNQKTSKYDLRMVSVEDVIMTMRASVMITPVNPAMVVNVI